MRTVHVSKELFKDSIITIIGLGLKTGYKLLSLFSSHNEIKHIVINVTVLRILGAIISKSPQSLISTDNRELKTEEHLNAVSTIASNDTNMNTINTLTRPN